MSAAQPFLLNSTASTSTAATILETTTILIKNVTAKFENNSKESNANAALVPPSNGTKATKDLNGKEDHDGITIPEIFNIFEKQPWLLYVFLALVVILVISVIVAIVCCILHNKKKVIRRGSSQAIFDYDQQTSGCFPFKRHSKTEEINRLARQNSASNMSPYGRNGPLPPLRGHLPPIRPETSPQPSTLGIHITSVKGVPEIHINPENSRPLPPIRPKTTTQ